MAAKNETRAPMDDHQFALAAREHLGKATNAEAYDELLDVTATARRKVEVGDAQDVNDALRDVDSAQGRGES